VVGVNGRTGDIGRMSDVDRNLESNVAGNGSSRRLDLAGANGKLRISLSQPRTANRGSLEHKAEMG
jgi:hypothetical protein